MPMFYRKAQFIVLTCIAVFLFILCLEVGHMDRAVAQNKVQKVAICDPNYSNTCAQVACYPWVNNGNFNDVCYLASQAWQSRKQ